MALKRIFISPLDWGLGHATRCIPVIKALQEKNIEVIIGANGSAKRILSDEFPHCKFVDMPSYNIKYSRNIPFSLRIALQVPSILKAVYKEHKLLKRIIKEYAIDAVISDNRYGLYNSKIPCIFITHQVKVKSAIAEKTINAIIKKFYPKYTAIWVPDREHEPKISGSLSHGTGVKNLTYIGTLSRFSAYEKVDSSKDQSILVILSGPENQRTVFENILLHQLKENKLNATVLRALPGNSNNLNIEGIKAYNHLPTQEFAHEINKATIVISRSGYTSLMDLAVFGKKMILVPTPGQTEQEYLADFLASQNLCVTMPQDTFSLTEALGKVQHTNELYVPPTPQYLHAAIDKLISSLK